MSYHNVSAPGGPANPLTRAWASDLLSALRRGEAPVVIEGRAARGADFVMCATVASGHRGCTWERHDTVAGLQRRLGVQRAAWVRWRRRSAMPSDGQAPVGNGGTGGTTFRTSQPTVPDCGSSWAGRQRRLRRRLTELARRGTPVLPRGKGRSAEAALTCTDVIDIGDAVHGRGRSRARVLARIPRGEGPIVVENVRLG